MKSDPAATPLPDCVEGPEARSRFDSAMSELLSVPRSTLVRREKAYRKKVENNPNRRGPKRKVKSSVSPAPAV
jgi:hypothetical protein